MALTRLAQKALSQGNPDCTEKKRLSLRYDGSIVVSGSVSVGKIAFKPVSMVFNVGN